MTFQKTGEMTFWMEVYVASAGSTAAECADFAVDALRARIPTDRPEGEDVLWPMSRPNPKLTTPFMFYHTGRVSKIGAVECGDSNCYCHSKLAGKSLHVAARCSNPNCVCQSGIYDLKEVKDR